MTHLLDLMPPTMITRDLEAIRSFRLEYRDIIVKPLFVTAAPACSASSRTTNLAALLEMLRPLARALMFQRYEPLAQGDKRIIWSTANRSAW